MNIKLLQAARELLENQTPMNRDCGEICGAACCQCDEDGQGGVFLFPGEEALVDSAARQIDSETELNGPTRLFLCDGRCDRSKRPLGCMIFPLTPTVDEAGRVDVRFDVRARPLCPLLRDGVRGLRFEFTDAVREALSLIAQDPDGLAFLRAWEALERQYDFKL